MHAHDGGRAAVTSLTAQLDDVAVLDAIRRVIEKEMATLCLSLPPHGLDLVAMLDIVSDRIAVLTRAR